MSWCEEGTPHHVLRTGPIPSTMGQAFIQPQMELIIGEVYSRHNYTIILVFQTNTSKGRFYRLPSYWI